MSLRLRLAASLALAFATILVLGGALFGLEAERRLEAEMTAARDVAANRVAALIAGLPAARDAGGELAAFARSFNGDRHVQVLLIDPGGRVREASVPGRDADPAPAFLGTLFGVRPATVVTPLSGAALPIAAAAITVDPAAELGEIWATLKLNALLMSLVLVLSVAMLYAVAGRALRPLGAMRAAVAALGAGDTAARVPVAGPPEIAALGRGFNEMAARLADMDARNRRLSEQVARMAEEERAELARDLHDEVGPALFAIDVDAAGVERLLRAGAPAGTGAAAERAAAIRRSAAGAKLAVRRLLGQLRPGVLPGLGLAATLRELVDGFALRHPDTRFALEAEDGEWGEATELLVLRAVREGVNNAVRHGRPSRVSVRVGRAAADEAGGAALRFSVLDDGGGLPAGGAYGGLGLVGMRERVEAAGGRLTVSQVPLPPGVRIEGVVPLRGRESSEASRQEREGRAA